MNLIYKSGKGGLLYFKASSWITGNMDLLFGACTNCKSLTNPVSYPTRNERTDLEFLRKDLSISSP